MAAPATFPFSINLLSAFSSTNPPLAQLTIRTPSLHFSRVSLFIMFAVWSVIGTCKVIISLKDNNSSRSTFFTLRSRAFSSVRKGSKAKTFILRPKALSATIDPIFPHPITPKVLPVISVPIYFDFSHLP